MRAIKLGVIPSHNLKGKILFAIDERWKDFLIGDPTFEVLLDKNSKLTLRGPVVQISQRNPTVAQEDVTYG